MGLPPDEHLPEVVPGQSPEVLNHHEAYYYQNQLNEQSPKYLAIYDDAPKYAAPDLTPAEHLSPVNTMTDPYSVMSPTDTIPWEPHSAVDDLNAGPRSHIDEKAEERTICGLRRRIFFLLVGLALLVIGGSVGGGLGAAYGRNNPTSLQTAVDPAATAGPTNGGSGGSGIYPNSTTPTGTKAPPPRPSFLNNQTKPEPGYAFQAFSDYHYNGNATRVYQRPDESWIDLPFPALSYVWFPNNTDCCVTFCVNLTFAGGFWCQDRRQPESSGPFPRIWIGCGEEAPRKHACS